MKQHKFVIADYKRCIGCATCMAACFKSAYERGKLSKARLSVLREAKGVMPAQCRQCDDGPCANVCPTGALRFDDSCIELHEEICIGCKMCTIACPYGAINSSAELMPSVNYSVEPKQYLEIESQAGAKNIAIKCDMCYGKDGGPACVDVCPTSALIMIDPLTNHHKLGKKIDVESASSLVKRVLTGAKISSLDSHNKGA
ncbi:4Fe-4S dicluster domain-containing protein [Campylobacter geochelonis]|uniref:Electron transport protein HydN n=1 Tax=Campylobacter geochelonis TaxID=1780362 RepID=A0A128EFZ7_9BACT|nr:4Fe-4S dicluster domain-containing protein [Campylobacter geochelonis]QKF71934.1 hydrogenase-4, iron-sulfur protein [Campylobacter geochelonis]CZE47845.1 electron transport protein HydN [Campylobacter geochelonis]